ncbi:toll/interleukin-1 receptor domain-containing protein [Janthinobacterium fluminis]|uniref:Toll/interleukin-1 receptor domain-containing protein n=1 Tax=Janthinobacterium fluminis TaxID=2987524 RepID=A0ABT5K6Y3_9BURK|nr:toll/interleukin-1 receptor domain-containing protein [Janthinobacterium fluminis]MDC8760771.1 toll/interleukin-1 receptor domain-containing protein [Janthinobacterium fluminis]
MDIRYGCFLSYAHGHYAHMSKFKDDLIDALKCYLEPHLDNEHALFVDSEQLGGGDDLDQRIARALCESVCMVALYTPKYEAHGYTRREFAAMQLIENERKLWYALPSHLIIPVIMTRHPAGLPQQIAGPGMYADFSGYTLASGDLRANPAYLPDIEKIVERIAIHYHLLKNATPAGHDCSRFVMPAIPPEWRAIPPPHFPR